MSQQAIHFPGSFMDPCTLGAAAKVAELHKYYIISIFLPPSIIHSCGAVSTIKAPPQQLFLSFNYITIINTHMEREQQQQQLRKHEKKKRGKKSSMISFP